MHEDKDLYEETKLIQLLAEDSEYAFQLLFDRYRNRVYQTSIRYLKSPVIAQEVVQDVFLKLWFKRKTIRPQEPLEAWLFTVAKNNILNRLEKIATEWKALKVYQPPTASLNQAEDKMQLDQYNLMLQNAIKALPEQQRQVFLLARHEQLTYSQIGEKMGISPLTVKTHMSRALNAIKNYFQAHGEIFLLALYAAFL